MTNGKILMLFEACKAVMKVMDIKIIVLIILFITIWWVAEGTKRKNEKKGLDTNVWKYVSKICFIIIAIILFLYLIPVLISSFVFFPDFESLNKISGTDEQWFAFWASYSGAAATVIIAIFTYSNSKSINKQEELF